MVDPTEAKAFVRMHRQNLKTRLSCFYASTLEPKIARSYSDDVDVCQSGGLLRGNHYKVVRQGLRDDDDHSTFIRMMPA
jgi:hypothetical protein